MTDSSFRLSGVVVLYQPAEDAIENIRSYEEALELLVIVDNSPEPSPVILEFARASGKILYVGDGVNRGIAWALNEGARAAREAGSAWLLTMDQDSRFEPGALAALIEGAQGERLGIVSPRHKIEGKPDPAGEPGAREAAYVMTSGNLLNLEAYAAAGPFLEKLFIDYVDCEYCLRLRKRGYRIVVTGRSVLAHRYGRITPRRLLGKVAYPTHHEPFRKYYIVRNRLYVLWNYPAFLRVDFWPFVREITKGVLFEDRRLVKLGYMLRGAADFLRGRYGPLRP
jgi:rhamnosyltransferase